MNTASFETRKSNGCSALSSLGVDALLVEFPIDLLYLTGLHLSLGRLILSPYGSALFVDGRYREVSEQQSTYPVLPLHNEAIQQWLSEKKIYSMGFDHKETSYLAFLELEKMALEMKNKGHSLTTTPLSSPIQKLRMIKSEEEIDALRKSASLGLEGHHFIQESLREGIREIDLALELEFFWKKRGASQLAFPSIIAFGASGAMPHYRAGNTRLTKNTAVLIDAGCVLNDYPSDLTRMAFFGSVPKEIERIFSIVEEAKTRAIAMCHKGVLVGEIDKAARSYIAEKGYGAEFIHSTGHGVGLEVHEIPTIRENGLYKDFPLQPGMVITIEPGIYLKGIGGVRLEDMILITENGHENLSAD